MHPLPTHLHPPPHRQIWGHLFTPQPGGWKDSSARFSPSSCGVCNNALQRYGRENSLGSTARFCAWMDGWTPWDRLEGHPVLEEQLRPHTHTFTLSACSRACSVPNHDPHQGLRLRLYALPLPLIHYKCSYKSLLVSWVEPSIPFHFVPFSAPRNGCRAQRRKAFPLCFPLFC